MLIRTLTIIITLSALMPTATAKTSNRAFCHSVDSIFSGIYAPDEPGAAVLIMKDGKKVLEHCYGIADIETRKPVTPKTNFCIASVSKQFSAVALMQLAEQGKLSLDDNVAKFFPEFKAPFFKDITLRHLLSHTSGIPDARPRADRNFVLTATDVASVQYMRTLDHLNFEPGCGKYEYINPTFQLAYQIVERVTGLRFDNYMSHYVFKPAKMKHTTYFEAEKHIDNMAHGYTPSDKGGYKEFDYGEETFFATKADGGIYTSITDFAKWEKALRNNVVWSADSHRQAYTPHVSIPADANYGYQPHTGYGYGFFIQHKPGWHPIVYHTGDNGGFTIYAGKIEETGVVFLFFSTRDNIDRMNIVNQIYDLMPAAWTHE